MPHGASASARNDFIRDHERLSALASYLTPFVLSLPESGLLKL